MGSILSAPPAPPPPPPPEPPPEPTAPATTQSAEAQAARDRDRQRRRAARGPSSTILTGASGVTTAAPTAGKTLLGT